MVVGARIGEWVVEDVVSADRFRCHRADSPFRKAILTAFRGVDRATAQQQAGHLSRLQHPNIGGVLGATVSGDELYVVAELVQGATLRSFLHGADVVKVPLRTAITVAYEIADALATAHERGFVHGDARPENVVLGQDGRARLVGFERMGTSDDLGVVRRYAAPELSDGRAPTQASDAFAFGVVLYELVRGGGAHEQDPRESSLDDTAPRPIRDLVSSLTHPDPVVRPTLIKARQVVQKLLLDLTETTLDETFRGAVEDRDDAAPMPARIGRFDIVRELGRGGVGVVYEGVDPVLARRVALKLLIAGSWARAREVQRFKLEAKAVARLDHPNVVKILDIGGDVEGAWFAMEYVAGPSLADRIAKEGALPWREAVSIAAQVGRALEHAHGHGLLHRDVKPNNVLLDGDRPKLADFGLALNTSTDETRLTGTGQVLGTPTYMAPEQAAGEIDRLGPHTDVYGLGVLLYEAITGQVPFEGSTPLQVIANILGGDCAPPRRHKPDLPRELDTLTLKALRLDPRERYPSAAAFADDLERLLSGDRIEAVDPTPMERLRRFTARHRRTLVVGVAAAATVALALSGGGVVVERAMAARRESDASEALAGTRRSVAEALAQGRPQDADAALHTFVGRPEYAGTSAIVSAWADRARLADDAGDSEARLSAVSSAFLAARRAEDVDATLHSLAVAAHDEREFALLSALGDLFARRYPHLEEPVRAQVRDALAARRHLRAASAMFDGDGPGRAAKALVPAIRTEWTHAFVTADPRLGQGGFLIRGSEVLEVDGHLVPRGGRAPIGARAVTALPWAGGALLVERGQPKVTRTALAHGGMRAGAILPVTEVNAAASADLDGDGRDELWVGAWRRLFRVDLGADGFRATPAHAETNESNSQIPAVEAADLDGDGRTDLVVAASEWGAYDVRWFGWDDQARELALRGRVRLGTTTDLALTHAADGTPRILACKVDVYANLRVFPEEAPTGLPGGVYSLAFDPSGEVTAERIHDGICELVFSGDIDGDGLEDVVVSSRDRSTVLVRRPDDGFDPMWLERAEVKALIQADADPQAELVLWDAADGYRVWVLGVDGATGELPPLVSPPIPSAVVPTATRAFVDAWRRADDLVSLGRLSDGQRAYRELASLHFGTAEGRQALLRAADLAFAREAFDEASALYQEAASAGVPDALHAAIRSLRAGRNEPGELALLRKAQAERSLDDEDAARLALLAPSDVPALDLTFDVPLDPRWTVGNPLWVERSAVRGELVLEPDGTGEILRLPLVPRGRWISMELDATVDTTEWGGTIIVEIGPRGHQSVVSLELGGRGGGEVVERRLLCVDARGQLAGGELPREPGFPLVASARVQVDGAFGCSAERHLDDWSSERAVVLPSTWPSGDWELRIRAACADNALVALRLRSLRLRGVEIADAPPSSAVDRGVVDGVAGPDPWSSAVAAVHRRDVTAVTGAIAAMDPADERRRALVHWLLHARLDVWGAVLRPALGDSFVTELSWSWTTPLVSQGRRDPALRDMLLRWTDGAELVVPTSEEDRAALQVLLLAKGATALHHGQWAAARTALEGANALGLPDLPLTADDVRWTRGAVAVGLVDLAEVATHDGDRDRAFALLLRAFDTTPTPLILGDVVRLRSGLAPLRQDPRWTWGD